MNRPFCCLLSHQMSLAMSLMFLENNRSEQNILVLILISKFGESHYLILPSRTFVSTSFLTPSISLHLCSCLFFQLSVSSSPSSFISLYLFLYLHLPIYIYLSPPFSLSLSFPLFHFLWSVHFLSVLQDVRYLRIPIRSSISWITMLLCFAVLSYTLK